MTNYKNLTWKDIRSIVETANEVFKHVKPTELLRHGEKGYYEYVLREVNDKLDAKTSEEDWEE